jgi:hypothetical protein
MMLGAPMSWSDELDGPEALALRAAGFVIANRATLERFLAEAGLSAAELSRRPIDPRHLAAVLDFLIAHEAMLLAFARRVDLPPEAAYEARRMFNGGAAPAARFAMRVPG